MQKNSSDRSFFVLTCLGTDRPGIVAEVTGFLHGFGCNVEESRMAMLGGEFGLLILASAPRESLSRLEQALPAWGEKTRLEVRLKHTESPQSHRKPGVIPYAVKTYAADHEGILYAISLSLADLGINIVSVSTSTHPAPISGTPLFQMEMEIDVPSGLGLPQVRAALDRIAAAENADVELSFGDRTR
jgi:glycine cleavage system transcriptional repressor